MWRDCVPACSIKYPIVSRPVSWLYLPQLRCRIIPLRHLILVWHVFPDHSRFQIFYHKPFLVTININRLQPHPTSLGSVIGQEPPIASVALFKFHVRRFAIFSNQKHVGIFNLNPRGAPCFVQLPRLVVCAIVTVCQSPSTKIKFPIEIVRNWTTGQSRSPRCLYCFSAKEENVR